MTTTDPVPAPAPERVAALRARVAAQFPDVRADLEALVRIPSVSNAEFDQAHVEASAAAVARLLTEAGMKSIVRAFGDDTTTLSLFTAFVVSCEKLPCVSSTPLGRPVVPEV